MADERDPDISRRYRELGAEEPPRALDDAILAASRRAINARPAPLVVPTGRSRWYFPVAAAAVITLAVAVTVQVERQKPDDEMVVATAPPPAQTEERAAAQVEKKEQAFSAPAAEQPRPARKPQHAPQPFTPEPPPATSPPAAAAPPSSDAVRDLAKSNEQAAAAQGRARADQAPASPPVAVEATPPPELTRRETEAARPRADTPLGARVMGQMQSKIEVEAPARWLDRIVELRKQGKHQEADKALAEFRRAYPDYKLSEEMRAKIEKR